MSIKEKGKDHLFVAGFVIRNICGLRYQQKVNPKKKNPIEQSEGAHIS